MNAWEAPRDCARCPRLSESRRAVVNGVGPLDARIMVVAQNPGREEEIHGYPLYERAFSGSRLREKLMPLAGIDPLTVRYENVARCRPPRGPNGDLPLSREEIQNCAPFLWAAIFKCLPEFIITLGAPALRWFFPNEKLEAAHGRQKEWCAVTDDSSLAGNVVGHRRSNDPLCHKILVVPMYHPAAAHPRRNPGLATVMCEDWARLGQLLLGGAQGQLGVYHQATPAEAVEIIGWGKDWLAYSAPGDVPRLKDSSEPPI